MSFCVKSMSQGRFQSINLSRNHFDSVIRADDINSPFDHIFASLAHSSRTGQGATPVATTTQRLTVIINPISIECSYRNFRDKNVQLVEPKKCLAGGTENTF